MTIPKIIHKLWIGQDKMPIEWIDTWLDKHPDWQFILWDEQKIKGRKWVNQKHIDYYMEKGIWRGVADVCRNEILFEFGGFYPGADSICLNSVEELFEDPAFDVYTLYENEKIRPGLLCPIHASTKGNKFVKLLVDGLKNVPVGGEPWKTTGNGLVTRALKNNPYPHLKIWPSHFFIPIHFTGQTYAGLGKIYATHEFYTTNKIKKLKNYHGGKI